MLARAGRSSEQEFQGGLRRYVLGSRKRAPSGEIRTEIVAGIISAAFESKNKKKNYSFFFFSLNSSMNFSARHQSKIRRFLRFSLSQRSCLSMFVHKLLNGQTLFRSVFRVILINFVQELTSIHR